ncbi:hypothetical protein GCM10011497_19360 [Elstera cyanobacteriorum]|uniref:Prevent-host-death protein n=1 Tax=Elstera cyanobacteriorum TaxID=2022747 RepID=A0A255XJC7_9PROT|nr:type II toxin-antitoxin system prevent-host-death family antitoxin [Elstera cyanobacteriorum]OYQ16982.1 prevent-host-death protein [Elstera cyanobacteriorum]GFZ89927.1 hypothetical protein GCM10011497_19360 [Elstera cyanobacteriorum]
MTTAPLSPIPLDEAQARFADLAAAAKAGEEAIVTKDGKAYVALIDAESLAYYHRLARERLNGLLIQDAIQGLEDVAAGRTEDAYGMLRRLRRARAPQS